NSSSREETTSEGRERAEKEPILVINFVKSPSEFNHPIENEDDDLIDDDEDDDLIDDKDALPHDLADSNDEDP
ncbi:hypothetical protein Tco_0843971, partial [Tanacetum coccineum]